VLLVAKVAAGAFAVALTRRPSRRLGTLAAVAGALLALYGAVLTVAGALVLTGVISASPRDEHAPRWHTLLWDPWFLAWGAALAVAGLLGPPLTTRLPASSVQYVRMLTFPNRPAGGSRVRRHVGNSAGEAVFAAPLGDCCRNQQIDALLFG
jgi:hypothetical protein